MASFTIRFTNQHTHAATNDCEPVRQVEIVNQQNTTALLAIIERISVLSIAQAQCHGAAVCGDAHANHVLLRLHNEQCECVCKRSAIEQLFAMQRTDGSDSTSVEG